MRRVNGRRTDPFNRRSCSHWGSGRGSADIGVVEKAEPQPVMPDQAAGPARTPPWLIVLAVGLPVLVIVGSVLQSRLDPEQLYRDPLLALSYELEKDPDFDSRNTLAMLGAISNLGVLLWCAAAAVCLFSVTLVRGAAGRGGTLCLFATGVISAMLMGDDLFQGHEKIYPALFGLREKAVFAIYGVIMLGYVAAFQRVIRSHAPLLFVASGVAFVLAMVFDIFDDAVTDSGLANADLVQRLGEDGFKLIGICLWSAYAARLSWLACRQMQQATRQQV